MDRVGVLHQLIGIITRTDILAIRQTALGAVAAVVSRAHFARQVTGELLGQLEICASAEDELTQANARKCLELIFVWSNTTTSAQ